MICNEHENERLPDDFKPGPTTVVCGQGRASPKFPGNQRLKAMVSSRVEEYSRARKKSELSAIVSYILWKMRENDPAPHFVVYKKDAGAWYVTTEVKAREKIGGMFRDCLYTRYKSSSKAKSYVKQNRLQQMIEAEKSRPDASSLSTSRPLLSNKDHKSAGHTLGSGVADNIQEKQSVEENPERVPPLDAGRDAVAESLLRMRQADADINLAGSLYYNRRLYPDPRAHLERIHGGATNDLYSNIMGVDDRRAAIERDLLLVNAPHFFLEPETQLYHHSGMAFAADVNDRRLATLLRLRESRNLASPYLSPLSPSLLNSTMLGVQNPNQPLLQGIRREPLIRNPMINQDTPLPFLHEISLGSRTGILSDHVLQYHGSQSRSTSIATMNKTKEEDEGQGGAGTQNASIKTLAEQIAQHYGDDEQEDVRPPAIVSSYDAH